MTTCRVLATLLAGLWAGGLACAVTADRAPPLPVRLEDTGLHHPDTLAFAPQYALWSDGAVKRRWIRLPRGTAIDASDPDAWVFPPGTRLWKEFALAGRPLETRFIERLPDGRWRFAVYVWSADGREARLASEAGEELHDVPGAPGGRWAVPSRSDCMACHGSAPVPVLGFSALQLSPDRDPLAPQSSPAGVQLDDLIASGRLRHYRAAAAPRIAANSPEERAALGVLHANCGHCHNGSAQRTPVPLRLAQSVADPEGTRAATRRSLFELRTRTAGTPAVVAGQPAASLLMQRMASREPLTQMPPLGTRLPDLDGLALIGRWISHHPPQETSP